MAELDIKGFVTPEQNLEGLYKFGDVLAKKQEAKEAARQAAAKQKEEEKKGLSAYLNTLSSKDYLTGTEYDSYITNKVKDLVNKGYIMSSMGMGNNDIYAELNRDTSQLAQESEVLKELERQRKEADDYLKTIPGADRQKFNEGWRSTIYRNTDGSLRTDLSHIDLGTDYASKVMDEYPVWTPATIDNLITKAGIQKYSKNVTVRGKDNVKRQTEIEMSAPLGMQPILKNGVFEGEFEMPHTLYMEDGQIKQMPSIDNRGNPIIGADNKPVMEDIKLLKPDDWATIKNDVPSYQFIKQRVKQMGYNPYTPEGDRIANGVAYQYLSQSAKPKTSYEEKKVSEAPVIKSTTNVYTGKGGEEAPKYTGNVFDEIDLSQYTKENKKPIILNNKLITLKNGSAEYEDGTPVQKGTIRVEAGDLPTSLEQLIVQTYPKYPLKKYAFLTIEDGGITSVQYSDIDQATGKPKNKSTKITRQAIENLQTAQTKKFTKEKKPGEVTYGKEEKQTKKASKDPLGLGL